ncbi:hypothetical protein ACFL6M_03440 [Candidatus Eisenbacteria bacterium]|uniref:T9SS type A sorting domain-containing protein n=1 Tax=Eiseniibacteriota bacterium TaxID=2212470 RepID=A0ABV6YKC9_UNCEI
MRNCLVAVLLIGLLPPLASPVTYLVNPEGTGDFPTIQDAINAAADGDRIELAEGTFRGDGNRSIDFYGKAVTVASRIGLADSCVIDCQGSPLHPARGFLFISGEGLESVVQGVTITDGYAWGAGDANQGGAISCIGSSPSVLDCVFIENTAGLGAGLSCFDGASPYVRGCSFLESNAAAGGGIYCWIQASPEVVDCLFADTEADHGGAVNCYESSPSFTGCEFMRHTAIYGGAVWLSYHCFPSFQSCTFSSNTATINGGAFRCWTNCSPTLNNCTLYGNAAPSGAGFWCNDLNGLPILENTIIAFSTQGEAIYCEEPSLAALYCSDVYGNAGGDWIGCLEDQWGLDGNIALDPLLCDPENGDFTIHHASPCAPGYNPACGLVGAAPVACGDIYIVNPDGTGDFATIQAAIDAAQVWDIIELTDGTFQGDGNRDIEFHGKAITVRSQNQDARSCIIDCEGSELEPHRGVVFLPGDQEAARLEGVTIRNGFAPNGQGGAIYLSGCAPTISGCTLDGNVAVYGGAVHCENLSAAVFDHCTIVRNDATHGGGANCDFSSASFVNCTFHANAAHGNGSPGACIECWSSADPRLENSIIANGSVGSGVACHDFASVTLSCCNIHGNAAGDWVGACAASQLGADGNISLAPFFCDPDNDDFHLWNYSPCSQERCGLIGAWPVGCWDPQDTPFESRFQNLNLCVTPNPSTGCCSICYTLPNGPKRARILDIYDPTGRLVRELLVGHRGATGCVDWNGSNALGHEVPPGVYFIHLRTGEDVPTKRIVVLK